MSHRHRFEHILVAVDGSEVAFRALEHAARIAKEDEATITAMHVIPSPPFETQGGLVEYYNAARAETKKWMKDVDAIAGEAGLALKKETVVGAYSVVDAIIGFAETESIDLIVIGTRGRTPSARMHLGSVASGLVAYAQCAVLIVR